MVWILELRRRSDQVISLFSSKQIVLISLLQPEERWPNSSLACLRCARFESVLDSWGSLSQSRLFETTSQESCLVVASGSSKTRFKHFVEIQIFSRLISSFGAHLDISRPSEIFWDPIQLFSWCNHCLSQLVGSELPQTPSDLRTSLQRLDLSSLSTFAELIHFVTHTKARRRPRSMVKCRAAAGTMPSLSLIGVRRAFSQCSNLMCARCSWSFWP